SACTGAPNSSAPHPRAKDPTSPAIHIVEAHVCAPSSSSPYRRHNAPTRARQPLPSHTLASFAIAPPANLRCRLQRNELHRLRGGPLRRRRPIEPLVPRRGQPPRIRSGGRLRGSEHVLQSPCYQRLVRRLSVARAGL
ncbi:hypothetical protein BU26DRAFT_577046, partial [Trematosphaeria pertusa]